MENEDLDDLRLLYPQENLTELMTQDIDLFGGGRGANKRCAVDSCTGSDGATDDECHTN